MDSSAETTDLSIEHEGLILALWKLRLNTYEIATKLKRPEWQIANRLMRIRTKGVSSE